MAKEVGGENERKREAICACRRKGAELTGKPKASVAAVGSGVAVPRSKSLQTFLKGDGWFVAQ
jgi:hypothetical protein